MLRTDRVCHRFTEESACKAWSRKLPGGLNTVRMLTPKEGASKRKQMPNSNAAKQKLDPEMRSWGWKNDIAKAKFHLILGNCCLLLYPQRDMHPIHHRSSSGEASVVDYKRKFHN